MNYKKISIKYSIVVSTLALWAALVSCGEFVKIDPPKTQIISETVFSNDATATSAMRGIYSLMMTNQSFANGGLEKYCGLSADELDDYSGDAEQIQFAENHLISANQTVLNIFWGEAYKYIENANAMIEGLNSSTTISSTVKNQLLGEAKFVRAYCHFNLTALFGDAPYVTSTDYRTNAAASRLSQSEVFERIRQDLIDAESLLASDYSFSNGFRSQPNHAAATALRARVALFMNNWDEAEQASGEVIANTDYALLADLTQVFLANSNEAIWQLQPVTPENSTQQAKTFILMSTPSNVTLRTDLVDSFSDDDLRLQNWIGSYSDGTSSWYFPYKYKVLQDESTNEYSMVLRLSEQYLIRAEARAHLSKSSESIGDLDMIRARAGLTLIADTDPGSTGDDLLLLIEDERRHELFSEAGHRWMDLVRTGRATPVLGPLKTDWQPTDVLYPIPLSEIKADPLLTQNKGY
jgi:starch-binding outer membrane protein, SusD/RagB family